MSDHKERTRGHVLQSLATLRMVRLQFDSGCVGVVVPEDIKRPDAIALDFGRRAPDPIDDLDCSAGAISGTLRFGTEYHWCSVPWEAITGITEHGPKPAARAWNPTVIQGGKPS